MFHFEQIEGDRASRYEHLLKQVGYLVEGERDMVANLANTASLLYLSLEQVNWAGYYLNRGDELVLGPFMGKPACIRIPFGKGVCGTAASEHRTQLVRDVLKFPGHIACDESTRSEIVVPMFKDDQLVAVLDIDSPIEARFDEEDQQYLERFARIVTDSIDWSPILKG